MNADERACEFEALICEVQSVAILVDAMKIKNKEHKAKGWKPAYDSNAFNVASDKMLGFASKFRALANQQIHPVDG